jgi:hypothetical protein
MVAAGKTTKANAAPTKGSWETKDINAMNMKNKPPSASGCLKKVLMPDLTHATPVRAGTTLSETGVEAKLEAELEGDMEA